MELDDELLEELLLEEELLELEEDELLLELDEVLPEEDNDPSSELFPPQPTRNNPAKQAAKTSLFEKW